MAGMTRQWMAATPGLACSLVAEPRWQSLVAAPRFHFRQPQMCQVEGHQRFAKRPATLHAEGSARLEPLQRVTQLKCDGNENQIGLVERLLLAYHSSSNLLPQEKVQ